MPIAGLGADLQEQEVVPGEGGLRRAAAGHCVARPIAGVGADFQDREVGQGEGGLRTQPGTASQCQLLAWGQNYKTGRWGKGKGGFGGRHPVTASECQLLAWGQICKSKRWDKGKGGCRRGRA